MIRTEEIKLPVTNGPSAIILEFPQKQSRECARRVPAELESNSVILKCDGRTHLIRVDLGSLDGGLPGR